jgi:hypothetical protein
MLRMKALDEAKSARALEAIERSARAQAQLIDDLLDISRIVAGKLRLEVRSVDPILPYTVRDFLRFSAGVWGFKSPLFHFGQSADRRTNLNLAHDGTCGVLRYSCELSRALLCSTRDQSSSFHLVPSTVAIAKPCSPQRRPHAADFAPYTAHVMTSTCSSTSHRVGPHRARAREQ